MAKILLGYGSNSVSNSSSRRNSEVDFSDVFGGPPRSSAQDFYYNELDHMDCIDDDVSSSANDGFQTSLFGLTEKPVFGDQIGVRKRYPSEDFYGDIFGGDQPLLSCSLSPRVGRNPFASVPGSRSMSPSRPLSPPAEVSGSPSKFSLPGRISNTDYMTSTSMNQSSKSSGRSLSRLSHTFQHNSVYQPSSLSRLISIDGKESSSDSKLDRGENGAEFIMNSNDNIQFHFSIYKWASKGVPMAMSCRKRSPSRPKERSSDDLFMENAKDDATFKDDSFSASKRRMPSTTQVREQVVNAAECKPQDDIGGQDIFNSQKSLDPISPKMTKSNMRPLSSLFGDVKEDEGNNKGKEARKKVLNDKVNKSKVHELYHGAEKEIDKSEGTAKVKDFVKIYNQESSSKLKSNKDGVGGSSRSWRWKEKDSNTNPLEAKNEVKTFEMQASSVSLGKTWSESIEVVDAESFLSEEQPTTNGNDIDSEPTIESTKPPPNIPATSVDYQAGKETVQAIDTQLAPESLDETQTYERKVKQWSKGKEGNIRALLSTMQYVLWPNSGWKPIPLVDIIEANAVKKSYQRALLCLHPDKLQQKGAAPYQKFIAERVFDTLQEAWDEFNSLGLL